MAGVIALSQSLWGQDAAVEERLNRLSGHIEDLLAAQKIQQERIAEVAKEVSTLREQAAKNSGNFASQDELRKLAEKVEEIDQKRVSDNERIIREIEKLGRTGIGGYRDSRSSTSGRGATERSATRSGTEKGFEYVIQSGDTLSTIALAYREKGVKITSDDILKANPGLKATSLQIGQKIFIPAP